MGTGYFLVFLNGQAKLPIPWSYSINFLEALPEM